MNYFDGKDILLLEKLIVNEIVTLTEKLNDIPITYSNSKDRSFTFRFKQIEQEINELKQLFDKLSSLKNSKKNSTSKLKI